jgi:hypothetical protein
VSERESTGAFPPDVVRLARKPSLTATGPKDPVISRVHLDHSRSPPFVESILIRCMFLQSSHGKPSQVHLPQLRPKLRPRPPRMNEGFLHLKKFALQLIMPRLQERLVGRLSKTALRWKYLRLFEMLRVLKCVQRKEGIASMKPGVICA